jgi:hypothetical protein
MLIFGENDDFGEKLLILGGKCRFLGKMSILGKMLIFGENDDLGGK